jgi:uncharacterized protein (DUF488 family)
MKTYTLLTIGYEGLNINEFIVRLKAFNITRLIDVREVPYSRKKGFSKLTLKDKLLKEKIEYIHLKSLGSPSTIRQRLKIDRDYIYFFNAYSKYLSRNMIAIEQLYNYLSDGINCIMCVERLSENCHRSVIAKKVQQYNGNGLIIKNI